MEEIVGVTCDVCRSGIKYPLCFQLNPCQHRACARCFHQFMPAGVFHRCPCQDCHEWITSSTLLELDSLPESATCCPTTPTKKVEETKAKQQPSVLLRQVQEVPHFQPDEQMDPFRHWAIQKPDLYTGLIYVAYRSSEAQATFYKSCFRAYDSTVFMDDDSTDEMVKIFARILHPLLFQPQRKGKASKIVSSNQGDDESSETPPRLLDPLRNKSHTPDPNLGEHYNRQDRQDLAMRCMYALSSGRVLTRAEQKETFGGTRKNLKHNCAQPPKLASTQQLARDLLRAYQASCLARKEHQQQQQQQQEKSPPKKSSSPPSVIVHDLRPDDDDSEEPPQETPTGFYVEPNWIPNDEEDTTLTQLSKSDGHSVWEKELGLDKVYGDEKDENHNEINNDPSPPVVPTILWILSAVFILSK